MNSQKIILLSVASVLLTACSTRELDDTERPSQQLTVPLQLSSGIKVSITRAFDTTWDIGNAIGVFTTVAGSGSDNEHPYIITKSGSYNDENIGYQINTEENTYVSNAYVYKDFIPVNSSQQVYLPANGSTVDVYAYYPYKPGVTLSSPLSITIPGTESAQTLAEQKAVDVLSAKKQSTIDAPIDIDHYTVQLLFEHMMTKVIVYVMSGAGITDSELTGNGVSSVQLLGQPTSATFAPVSRTLDITTPGSSSTITMQEIEYNAEDPDPDYRSNPLTYTKYKDDSPEVVDWTKNVLHVYRAIVLPNNDSTNQASSTARKIRFNVGQTTYTYSIPADKPFESGKQICFAVRLAATGVTVEAAIKNWTSETYSPDPLYPDED